jgi:hypothetical protein
MIEGNFVPSVAVMAVYTARLRVIFGIEHRLMDVLMAIVACDSYLPEAPSFTPLMTAETGCSQVCSSQFKGTLVMHFNGIGGLFKSLEGMTLRTIRDPLLCHKLFVMVIEVAIHTPSVLKLLCITCFMATGAGYCLMTAFKGIAGK